MRWATLVLSCCWIASAGAADWPQWLGPQRDGVWSEPDILERFPEGGPTIRWRVPIHGGYSGPAVAAGRVFVTDYQMTAGKRFNDPGSRAQLSGQERILCLDTKTGKELWKHAYPCTYEISYPAGPRATPTVDGDRVYCLGAEGHLLCLQAQDGRVLWSKELKAAYQIKAPIWGFCAHPLVDGNKLITMVGGAGSIVVAFDKHTGQELWKSGTTDTNEAGYCPPSIITAGGRRQLLVWDPDKLNSLDPETGAVFWTVPLKPAYGMSIMAPRQSGEFLFAGGIGPVGVLLQLDTSKPAAKEVWRGTRTKGLAPVNMTPQIVDGILYGVDQPGQLRGVRLADGERLWETFVPTTGKGPRESNSGTAFLIRNGDRFFLFSETGHLIIAKLTPAGYQEISRAKVLEPTNECFGRDVVWNHPAFAERCCFVRNDREIVCVELGK